MTTPYPPKAPKRLERSRNDKFLFGVCGGVARYLNLDPTLVRVLTVILTVITGVPLFIYLVMVFVMPEESLHPSPAVYPAQPPAPTWTPPPAGFGTQAGPADPLWGSAGAPWEQPVPEPVPVVDPKPSEPVRSQHPAPADPEAPIMPPAGGSATDQPGDSAR